MGLPRQAYSDMLCLHIPKTPSYRVGAIPCGRPGGEVRHSVNC